MIVSIHQPQFIPWPGYFYKILKSDLFVLYDTVQFPRGKHFGNRNSIKTHSGPIWLTVPVLGKSELRPYRSIEVDPSPTWKSKQARTLDLAYAHAPFYDMIVPRILELYQRESWTSVAELDEAFLRACINALGCDVTIIRASDLASSKNDLRGENAIGAILKEVGATSYISGRGEGSRRYVNPARFALEGIELFAYDFSMSEYPQGRGEFLPDLSVIDLIAHVGDEARSLIERSGALTSWISA